MFVKDVTVENQVGLHARPATFFIQKANEFKSSIWVEKEERRPDLIIFVNGIPLVVIELKSASDENVGIEEAYNQNQTYKNDIPCLFNYNAFWIL